jgi:hypothetical protein
MSSSDEEEILLLALSCKRKGRRWWMHEINEKRVVLRVTCIVQEHVLPHLFQLIFQWILPPFRTARLANLSTVTTVRCPPRQPALCLTGMMQSYVIQFQNLPAASTDRCPPRQPAFCVAGPLFSRQRISTWNAAIGCSVMTWFCVR